MCVVWCRRNLAIFFFPALTTHTHTHKLRFRLAFFDRPLKVSHLFLVCFDSAQARRVQRPAAVKSITTTAGFFGCCIARSGIAGDDDDGDDPQNNGTKYLLARGDTSA